MIYKGTLATIGTPVTLIHKPHNRSLYLSRYLQQHVKELISNEQLIMYNVQLLIIAFAVCINPYVKV